MKLIINADDFGMSKGVNLAIKDLAAKGKLSSTTVMVNMPYWKEVGDLLQFNRFGIGLHFNIVKGNPISAPESITSLIDEKGCFYPRKILIHRFRNGKVNTREITVEFESQFKLLQAAIGERLSHIDTHHGIHNLHWVCHAIMRANLNLRNLVVRSDLSGYIKERKHSLHIVSPILRNISVCGFQNVLKEIYYKWVALKYQRSFIQLDGTIKHPSGDTLTILDYFRRFGVPNSRKQFFEIACHPAISLEELDGETMLQSRVKEYNMLNNHLHLNELTLGTFQEARDVS
jgi:hypothetical protein